MLLAAITSHVVDTMTANGVHSKDAKMLVYLLILI
jgi:hypothetical protein